MDKKLITVLLVIVVVVLGGYFLLSKLAPTHIHAFEWAGVFDLEPGEYTWQMQKVEGSYADPAMKMLIVRTSSADVAGIEAKEDSANTLFEGSGINKNDGETLIPGETLYNLILDDSKDAVKFTVSIIEAGAYIFFTEHFPYEFEATEHFLKDINNEDVEPSAEHPGYDDYLKHMEAHAHGHAHTH